MSDHESTTGPIDAEILERMARIARGLPGRTISVDSRTFEPVDELGDSFSGDSFSGDAFWPEDCWPQDAWDEVTETPPESTPVLRIDGVVVAEILERLAG